MHCGCGPQAYFEPLWYKVEHLYSEASITDISSYQLWQHFIATDVRDRISLLQVHLYNLIGKEI